MVEFSKEFLAKLPVPHDDGSFISEKVSRVVELVREYDPNLDVRWIKPELRSPTEPAFAVVERMADGLEAVVFYIQDERDFDGRVLQRLYENDATKQGNILTKIESQDKAVRALQKKCWDEQQEEASDLAYHILRSPKSEYKHNGIKYID